MSAPADGLDLAGLRALVEAALERLVLAHGGAAELPEQDLVTLEVRFEDGRRQRVAIYLGEGSPETRARLGDPRLLHVDSLAGPWTEVVDDGLLLEHGGKLLLSRVLLRAGDPEELFVQGTLPLSQADPRALAYLIEEVAVHADMLEEAIYGVDDG